MSDSRTRKFIQKYGKLYSIEPDALAGLDSDAFKQLVQDAIDEHFNDDIWRKVQKKRRAQKQPRKS